VRLHVCLGLALALGLSAAAPAEAHLKGGVPSTDFEARIAGFRPAVPGLHARALDGDQRLELRVAPDRVVVVLGLLGEPFLRFSRSGVEANLASPTATSMLVVAASDAVTGAGVHWRRVTGGHTFAWHEHRLRPLPIVRNHASEARAVASWSIPLLVDGRPATLTGSEWYASRPRAWPWLVTSALLIACAAYAARRLSRRAQRRVAYVLLPLAVGALLAAWFGTIFAGRVTLVTAGFAVAFAGATALLLVVAMTAATGTAKLGLMALIGALCATFAVPEVAVFDHGFVLSALPDLAERLAVATAIVSGLMTAAICAPAVGELLGVTPGRRFAR
jgi:hypothetical protein